MNWRIIYYNEKVQNEIDSWPVSIPERIVVFGPNLGMPFTRSIGDGLFEIRAKGREGIGRAFFCTVVGSKVMILHSFIKKSQKTPAKELAIARRRENP
ncbi:MAG: type II toxin-antitoxin system RelE/ParE family toxin [Deltaproteobacteria bacterium]|nr:type II toxin-antitoxin system RelE/ParE family toxin [Deltaproteobacteria bacterium]